MIRKSHVIGIIISLLLIISMFSTMGVSERNEIKSNRTPTLIFNDELDQSQTNIDEWIFVDSYIYLAQSFVPQLNILTRVELLLSKDPDFPPSSPFELAIRDSLTGDNLAHNSVNPGQIPGFPSSDWIEFDLDDISVTTGETYYIIAYTDDYEGYLWGHAVDNPYPYGMMHYSMDGGNTWGDFATLDGCFKTYGIHEEGADLTCEGSLSWNDVQGGSNVEGNFIVENIGDPGTLLDWEIESYPEWGTWTFDPDGGTGLTPEDGAVTVDVEVIAPDDPDTEFEGEVKIINSENSGDYCIIDVSLVTPVIGILQVAKSTPIVLVFQLIAKLRNHKDIHNVESEEDVLQIIEEDEELNSIFKQLTQSNDDCGCEEENPTRKKIWRFPVICMYLLPWFLLAESFGSMGLGIAIIIGSIAYTLGCRWMFPNTPPEVSPIDPYNGEINVPLSLSELRFQISDADEWFKRYTVTTSPDIGSGSGILKLDGIYSIPISGLEELTEYTWHIEVTARTHTTVGDYSFTTAPKAPVVSNPNPYDGARYIPIDLTEVSFHLKDYQGDPIDYTVETIPDIGSGGGSGVGEGNYSIPVSGLDYYTEHTWYVNTTDGENPNSAVFTFQTELIQVFDPFVEGWQYRKEITIDHTLVDGDLNNFPILISAMDGDLRDKAQVDGEDILFMDDSGVANRLYHEIEYYDGSVGTLVSWVNIPSLLSNQDLIIYMYYGNSSSISQETPELVWDPSFEAIWHMEDGTSSQIYDSTFNGNAGFKISPDNPQETLSGKIGSAQDFERDLYAYITSHGTYTVDEDDEITFSAWIKIESFDPDVRAVIMSTMEGATAQYVTFWVFEGDEDPSARRGALSCSDNNQHSYTILSDSTLDEDTWYHIAGVMDRNEDYLYLYVNGILQTDIQDISSLGSCDDGTNLFFIGAHDPDYGYRGWWDGILDELRVSNIPRNSEWISTEYNNQNDPSSFYIVGPEVPAP